MFRAFRELSLLVRAANDIAEEADRTGQPRWSLFLKNRSFIVQVVSFIMAIAVMFGVPLPGDLHLYAEGIAVLLLVLGQVWALFERLVGKTRVVWNRKQAQEAVVEASALPVADKLSDALRKAGVEVPIRTE